ncbi:MAG: hypothetical protein DHS20C14_20070 [Phycisphaeraceae bacterium]|nr:MAG: hypothetical protein DHS20C14_20070 [Phycisphaeraceae bacterium]
MDPDPTPTPSPPKPDAASAPAAHALARGNLAQADTLAAELLTSSPGNARALMIRGVVARDSGRSAHAIDFLERAHAAAPADAEILYHLAQAHHQAPRGQGHAPARELYERAMALAPTSPFPPAMLAKLLEETNELPDARAAADRALKLDATNPTAQLVAALLDRREGNLTGARERFMQLIYANDGRTLARFPPAARAMIWNRHAHTLDALGEHDAAFAAFEYAQTLRWSLPDAQRVDPSIIDTIIDRSLEALTRDRLARWAQYTPADGRTDPAFLVGFPRSGTTLTEQILAAHPSVVTLDEDSPLADLDPIIRETMPAGASGDGLEALNKADLERLREAYFAGAERRLGSPPGARTLIDKLPLSILDLPAICRAFPRAKLIVAIRDPRDACLSAVMRIMVPNPAMAHLRTLPKAADFYARVMDLWLTARARVRNPWIESRYEDLASDPEPAIRRLTEFLELPWDDAVLSHHEHVRGKTISTPSYEAVGGTITTASVGRWHAHAQRIRPIVPTLAPFLEVLEYER